MRTSTKLSVAALTLSICSSVLAPSTAMAAPPQDALPDLVIDAGFSGSIQPTQNVTIPLAVSNEGGLVANGVEVEMILGPGLALSHDPFGNGWSCKTPVRTDFNRPGTDRNNEASQTIMSCSTPTIAVGQSTVIRIPVHGETFQSDRGFWYLQATVDPKHRVPESNTGNNLYFTDL